MSAKTCKCCGGTGWEGSDCALVRPDPSRLEIAAMLVLGRYTTTILMTGDDNFRWVEYALKGADALIKAAKQEEAK